MILKNKEKQLCVSVKLRSRVLKAISETIGRVRVVFIFYEQESGVAGGALGFETKNRIDKTSILVSKWSAVPGTGLVLPKFFKNDIILFCMLTILIWDYYY